MAGVNLRGECMEVAFELWTERTTRFQVGSNVIPTLSGNSIVFQVIGYCAGRVQEES